MHGRQIWRHRRNLPDDIRACCGPILRGFGVLGDRLFLGTADAHLLALDMQTGGVIWDAELTNYKSGYSATAAPLVVKDKVIIGIAGAENGIRGFIDAYDVQTGKRLWRFYTVAGPDEPGGNTWPNGTEAYLRGGGPTWMTGTYDPEQNLILLGCRESRAPTCRETCARATICTPASVVALDADTGKIKWHFQFTPHDTHDWDSTQCPDWPISPSTASRGRRSCSPTATVSSTCSTARTGR